MHGFKVAFRISGQVQVQVMKSPSEELLSMLRFPYTDNLVLVAPNSSNLKTGLEEWLGSEAWQPRQRQWYLPRLPPPRSK